MYNLIYYALAAGLNRGAMFLLLPISALFLSLEVFGEFSIVVVSSQIISYFLMFNVTSVIAREFLDNSAYVKKFSFIIIVFVFLLILVTFLVLLGKVVNVNFFSLIIILSLSEASFLIVSTLIRFFVGARSYLFVTLFKFLLLLASVGVSYVNFFGEDSYLIIVACIVISNLISSSFWLVFFRKNILVSLKNFSYNNIYLTFLVFGCTLLPHTLSQWVMSSADRYAVKHNFSDNDLGLYSLSYSYASVYMLFISACALGFPELCVRYFRKFVEFEKFFILVTFAVYLLHSFFLLPLAGYLYPDTKMMSILILIFLSGLFFLSIYHYYASIIFYERRAKSITYVTIFSSLITLILLYFTSESLNLLYVALVTPVSYFCYMGLTMYSAGYFKASKFIFIFSISFFPYFLLLG